MSAKFNEIYDAEILDELFEKSKSEPVVFFKHSITCPISKRVFQSIKTIDTRIWLMVVQDSKRVSDALARRTGIKHETPQTIIIRDEKPIYSSALYDMSIDKIVDILEAEKALI